ncbi:hypothetical protein P167DRAFT_250289 [Morchella conica CCBAS932]|uniref:Uncharacterized protein n=1 Tax=Morchella conica CCBAS932 TaxID=1392247 RepID=A0A3N4KMH2_9PEZI|nr:hypothetical protein P167DRAFT_250289 [Morchella conica CCBAS932]
MSTPGSPDRTLRNNRLSTTRQSTLINTLGRELGTTGATDPCSYRAYLRRIRGSPAYWFLYDQMHIFAGVPYNPPAYNPVNPVSILEVASDGSTKLFSYETLDDLKAHLKSPFAHNGYAGMPNQGRRVVLVTDIRETVLEVLGDTHGMDFGFFADHLLPDEHISYTSKTTRGSHLHILEETKPESRRFQFEYRELGRTRRTHRDTRNVCRVFEKPSGLLNWDAIFQRRFSCFTCSPPSRGLTTDIYLFDEHAFRGPFALTSRLNLPSFLECKEGDAAFDRSLGINRYNPVVDPDSQRTPFQQELVDFFKSSDFNAIRAFENFSYLVAYILKPTLVMWRHLLVRIEHSFLGAMEGRITSDDVHDLTGGSLSSVSAEL